VLMHLGHYAHNLSAPPPNVVEVRAHIRLLPPRGTYASKARFLKSREWVGSTEKPQESCCYKVGLATGAAIGLHAFVIFTVSK